MSWPAAPSHTRIPANCEKCHFIEVAVIGHLYRAESRELLNTQETMNPGEFSLSAGS